MDANTIVRSGIIDQKGKNLELKYSKKGLFPFTVFKQNEFLYLSAVTEIERDSWMQSINENLLLTEVSSSLETSVLEKMLEEIVKEQIAARQISSPKEMKRSESRLPTVHQDKDSADLEIPMQLSNIHSFSFILPPISTKSKENSERLTRKNTPPSNRTERKGSLKGSKKSSSFSSKKKPDLEIVNSE